MAARADCVQTYTIRAFRDLVKTYFYSIIQVGARGVRIVWVTWSSKYTTGGPRKLEIRKFLYFIYNTYICPQVSHICFH